MKSSRINQTISEEQIHVFLVFFATVVGLLIRLALPLASSFPLNDGGLFYVMIRDLQAMHYSLPVFTTYNQAHIPFAYPPMAFYITGLIGDLTRIPLLDLIRLLPALVSAACIPVFYLLAKEFMPSRPLASIAAFLFALTPRLYEWQIMGGGITRSFGFFFALLTIYSARKLYLTHSARSLLWASVWAAMTILTHPEAIPHVVLALLLIYLFTDRSTKGFLLSISVAVIAILISAPWWITVLSNHGFAPLLAAASTGGVNNVGWFLRPLFIFQFDFTGEPYLRFIAVFGLIGLFYHLGQRAFFLPTWMVLHYLIEPRSGSLYMMIPLILLASFGLELIFSAFQKGSSENATAVVFGGANSAPKDLVGQNLYKINYSGFASLFKEPVSKIFFLFLTVYFLMSGYITSFKIYDRATLKPPQLEATAWIRENTRPDGAFLVITGEQPLLDPISDWFPALTGRRSLGTVFGYEWVNDGQFAQRVARYEKLQKCVNQSPACLEIWGKETGMDFTYIYIDQDISAFSLEKDGSDNNKYTLIYQTEGVRVIERKGY
jgi:hypothetical protein